MALARAAATRALAAAEDQPHTTQEPDPNLAFARHSRSVRQSVELWEKITNNAFARAPQSPNHPPSEPQDRPLDPSYEVAFRTREKPPFCEIDAGNLYEAVATLARASPTHATIPETLIETIEETLTAHPDDHLSTNFARICQIFSIEPDRSRLQPHLESQLRPPPDRYPKRE